MELPSIQSNVPMQRKLALEKEIQVIIQVTKCERAEMLGSCDRHRGGIIEIQENKRGIYSENQRSF